MTNAYDDEVLNTLSHLGFNTDELLADHVDLNALLNRLNEGVPVTTALQALAYGIDLVEFDARHGGDTLADYEFALDQFVAHAATNGVLAVTAEE